MNDPSSVRKYYLVNVITNSLGEKSPDVDFPNWTTRYLSEHVALVRDPNGIKNYPVFGVDVFIENALNSLPIELPLSLSQQEADTLCDLLEFERIDISSFAQDRVDGK